MVLRQFNVTHQYLVTNGLSFGPAYAKEKLDI